MPLFSEHITNMYYSGAPSYSGASSYNSAPYSYSGSPYGTSYSASYLNPGGNFSTHSSIGPYTRTLSSRWLLGGGRNYSPILSTISEKGSSSPVRINSPRRTPISSRSYISSSYTPRPININTADIDVSRDKYRNKTTSTSSVNAGLTRLGTVKNEPSPPKVSEKSHTDVNAPHSSSPPHRSTIKRDRPVVRLHTVKRKERDSPRQAQSETLLVENFVGDTADKNKTEPLKWRERLAEDLAFKNKKEKKTIGEKLVEKFTLKERYDNEEEISTTVIPKDENVTQSPGKPSTIEVTLTDKTQLLGRRCSVELLAEQASLLDSLIRRENLSTASLDLSKIGAESVDNVNANENVGNKNRKFEPKGNALTTTKSDHSLFSKYGTNRKSLRKSTSGDNICKLNRIPEISQLHSIEHTSPKENKQEKEKKLGVNKNKPKLKPKITSNIEVSSSSSPLKAVVENIIVEEKPLPRKKGTFYSTAIEEVNEIVKPNKNVNNALDTGHRKSVKIKLKAEKQQEAVEIVSPDPEDGNFWGKIGKRETIYLSHRKQDLEKASEEKKRSFGWFPEDEEITLNKNNVLDVDSKEQNNNMNEINKLNDVEILHAQNNLKNVKPIGEIIQQNQFIENQKASESNPRELHINLTEKNFDTKNVEQETTNIKEEATLINDSSQVIVCTDVFKTEDNIDLKVNKHISLDSKLLADNSLDPIGKMDTKQLNKGEVKASVTICEGDIVKVEDNIDIKVSKDVSLKKKSLADNSIEPGVKMDCKQLNKGEVKEIITNKDNIAKKVRKSKEKINEKSPQKSSSHKINKDTESKFTKYKENVSAEKNTTNTLEHYSSKSLPELGPETSNSLSKSIAEATLKSDSPLINNNDLTSKTTLQNVPVDESKIDCKNHLKEPVLKTVILQSEGNKVLDALQDEENNINQIESKDSESKEVEAVQVKERTSMNNKSQNDIIDFKDIPCSSPEELKEQTTNNIKTETETPNPNKRDSIKTPAPVTATNFLFANKKPVKDVPAPKQLIATPRPLQKKPPQVIRSSSSSESSTTDESSDEDENESSQSSTDFNECENIVDGRTSTCSNDSGFDSSAPTSPSGFSFVNKDCDVNCHRKCEKLTANLCGVNQRLLVEALASRTASKKGGDHPSASTSGATNNATDIVQQELEQSTAYGLFRKTGKFTPPARSIPRFRKYTIDDFQFIKVLGKGSFGKVMLAELRETEYYYAVKCLKKDVVLEDDDVECTLIERKVLALGTNHPYLCHLFATFQTDSHLFFVMEYLNGGDLMFHIQQSGRFPEPRARFYAAEIVSGLKFLHKRGIVYRDLKLDNILLDFDGHVRIADFGMCKLQIYLDKTADTFCGTPDYMAPEIIKGLKYNQAVDWWSFGVLLYEMLIGQSPFSGCDEDELFWSICNEMPSYPRFLSSESLSILTRLLDKDARTRLGGAECMHGDIRDQDFFKPIQWDKLDRRELETPFKPRVRHPLDTQYFDRAFTGSRPRLTAVDPQVLRSMDQEPFRGFSYTNPNATDR